MKLSCLWFITILKYRQVHITNFLITAQSYHLGILHGSSVFLCSLSTHLLILSIP